MDRDVRNFLMMRSSIHSQGHSLNYKIKANGGKGIEESFIYKITHPIQWASGRIPWSKEVDLERAEYHRREVERLANEDINIFSSID